MEEARILLSLLGLPFSTQRYNVDEYTLVDHERWVYDGGPVSVQFHPDSLHLHEEDTGLAGVTLSPLQALALAGIIRQRFGAAQAVEKSQKQQEQNASYNSEVGR